ncbi:MAG: SH3 domain-containing protein [Acetobacter fabarum]|uniref:SH3 domain-containing protein n=1 Tax=Acetobacter fabarum TaxID=483199 RepID=UPI0039EA8FCB
MMCTRSSFRFRLLACVAGCMAAFSGITASAGVAADGVAPPLHKHHKHALTAPQATAAHKAGSGKAKTKGKHEAAATRSSKKGAHHKKHETATAQAKPAHHAPAHHHVAAAAAGAAVATAAAGAAVAAPAPGTPDMGAPDAGVQNDPAKGSVTGLPLPRYAALRSDEVNMRAGPGQRFPILWVYHRRGMPVRVEREFDVWRLVEDPSGQKGWMQQATLAGGRDFLIPGEPPGDETPLPAQASKEGEKALPPGHMDARVIASVGTAQDAAKIPGVVFMRAGASEDAAIVAVLRPGTVGSVRECAAGSAWCKVSVKQYNGWVPRRAIWGVDAEDVIGPS